MTLADFKNKIKSRLSSIYESLALGCPIAVPVATILAIVSANSFQGSPSCALT